MTDASFIALTVDRNAHQPLVMQIYEALRQRITAGRLRAGATLPASRSFALELGVSRSTITQAYEQLIAEGYLESRRGAGVYVCDLEASDIGGLLSRAETQQQPVGPVRAAEPVRAARQTLHHGGADDSTYLKDRNTSPRPIALRPFAPVPFAPGLPDMRLFPYKEWGRCAARVARACPQTLIGECDKFGDLELRAALCRHLAEWRGIDVAPAQIIITAGAGDALELTIRTLTKKGDIIALENPGYPPLRRFALSLGLVPHWLSVDHDGAVLPPLPAPDQTPPKLTVLTPSHQFPLGGTMGTARRTAFLALAQQTGSWIIEDDFDSEFRYTGRPIPALAGLEANSGDTPSRVIYIGSLAKIFSKGLRLGFLVIPQNLIDPFGNTLNTYGHKASLAAQRPLASFINEGLFHRHIRRMRRIYGARRRVFLDLLQDQLSAALRPIPSSAGLQIAVTLAPQWHDVAISEAAKAQGLICPPLSQYYAAEPSRPGLLMGFSAFSEDEMRAPMAKLRQIIAEHKCS